jgi:hypothetical protein
MLVAKTGVLQPLIVTTLVAIEDYSIAFVLFSCEIPTSL